MLFATADNFALELNLGPGTILSVNLALQGKQFEQAVTSDLN